MADFEDELREQFRFARRHLDVPTPPSERAFSRPRRRRPPWLLLGFGAFGAVLLFGLPITLVGALSGPAPPPPAPLADPTTTLVPPQPSASAPRPSTKQVVTPSTASLEPAQTTTTTSPRPAALAPATVRPVVGECSIPLIHEADGNAMPRLCPDGGINVLAWHFYAQGGAGRVLALGPSVTAARLLETLCGVYSGEGTTQPIGYFTAQLAGVYYGWPTSVQPSSLWVTSCVHPGATTPTAPPAPTTTTTPTTTPPTTAPTAPPTTTAPSAEAGGDGGVPGT